MKRNVILMAIAIVVTVGNATAQQSLFGREGKVGGELRFGTPYFQLFGAKLGESEFSAWVQLDITDTQSGIIFSAYHLGDFVPSTPTNFWGLDVIYPRVLNEKYSITALVECFYFSHFPDMQGVNPSVIVTRKGLVDVTASVLWVYFPRQAIDQHQFATKVEFSKEVLPGLSFRTIGWYDNLYGGCFWVAGTTVDLTGGYLFKFDGLMKNEKFTPIIRVIKVF